MWWLAESLRELGVPVQYPQLPTPHAPSLEEWTSLARAELEMLGDGERVVVTHSLGGILWQHVASEAVRHGHPERLADRVLMVAPPHPSRLTGALAPFALDGTEAPALSRVARDTSIVTRETDPYRPGPAGDLARDWGLAAHVLPGAGHLNPDDGHGPWQSVLDWVVGGGSRDTGAGEVEWRLGEGARSLDA